MLQQILRDMYVDPDILAGLDEQQKQTLFCAMREEQVRRWKLWNEQLETDNNTNINNNNNNNNEIDKTKINCKRKKSVSFLEGEDGEPWVWVMGEHPNDKSIDDILKEEAIDKARRIAEREAEELRRHVEAQLCEYIELTPKIEGLQQTVVNNNNNDNSNNDDDSINSNEMDIYCSVEELRDKINNQNKSKNLINYNINHYQNKNNKYNMIDTTRDVLQEISLNTQKVAQRVALWEKRLTEERTCEIFKKIQKKQREVAREAEEAERRQEQQWREQERKAKQAEQQIREIARKAREEHRLTSTLDIDTAPYSTVNTGVPPGRSAILAWFQSIEKSKLINNNNNYELWFHGLITRSEAEKLLLEQPCGTFLVRLSEKIWGYAISYRSKEKCKHYLISANNGQKYQFLGNNQIEHQSLRDLIEYHKEQPLTGGEKLLEPCPRRSPINIDDLCIEQ